MKLRSVLVLIAIASGSTLWAAAPMVSVPDLRTTLTVPTGVHVYETGRYTYTVKNIGHRTAAGSKLVINLPRTGTSPQVYVMGTVIGYSTRCTLAGTTLTCPMGNMSRNATIIVFVDLRLAYSTAPIVLDATASTTTLPEPNQSNNRVIHTADLLTYPVTMSHVDPVVNQHCTGNASLSSYFECTLFPSSITEHETTFNADNTISFVGAPASYTGTWTYTAGMNRLQFEYFDGLTQVAVFDGRGVGSNCFEGKTTFPAGTGGYVSMYRICFP